MLKRSLGITVLTALVLGLTACNSGGMPSPNPTPNPMPNPTPNPNPNPTPDPNPNPGTSTFSKLGVVSFVSADVGLGSPVNGAFARFSSFTTPQPSTSVNLAAFPEQCLVASSAGGTPTGIAPLPEGLLIDAGDPITFKSGANVLATFKKDVSNAAQYSIPVGTSLANLPAGATLDIPGASAGFPAFTGVVFPSSAPLDLKVSGNDFSKATKDSTFTWTKGNGIVLLSGQQRIDGTTKTFDCLATDDGSFSFPAAAKAALDAQKFTTFKVNSGGRILYSSQAKGDATLILLFASLKALVPLTQASLDK